MHDFSLIANNTKLFNENAEKAYADYLKNQYVNLNYGVWSNYYYNKTTEKTLPLYHDSFCNIFLDLPDIISSIPGEKLTEIIPYFINQFLTHDQDAFLIIKSLFDAALKTKSFDSLETILDQITSVKIKGNIYWTDVIMKDNTTERLAVFLRTPNHFFNKYKILAGINYYNCESLMLLIQNNQLTDSVDLLFTGNKQIFLQILPEVASSSFYNNQPEFLERSFISLYKNKSLKQRSIIKRLLLVEQNKEKSSNKDFFDRNIPLLDTIDSYYTLNTDLPISENKIKKIKI